MSYFEKYQKYKSKYEAIKIEMKQMLGGHNIINNQMYKNDKNEELRCIAHIMGQEMLDKWIAARTGDIDRITPMFNEDGTPIHPPSATTFSDLYKWTMMPVIRKLESYKNNNCIVTFGIDLRDKNMRKELKNPDGILVGEIHAALKRLETRPFDRAVFDKVLAGPRATILTPSDVDAICIQGGAIRTLVDAGGVKDFGVKYERTADDNANGKVTLTFYEDRTKEYAAGEMGVHFIEASGPWHRVTWLETSMMQCVYEAKLRYDLRNHKNARGALEPITYNQWLYHALLRCAKSVAYTYLIQRERPGFKPALFTGRRTGGLLFLLLQNLFFADHFNQFNGLDPTNPRPVPLSLLLRVPADGTGAAASSAAVAPTIPNTCLGTSSVDCWYILGTLGLPCVSPVGTHAHELSMVISVLFPHVDQNPQHLPLTQIIGHYLYSELVWKKTKGPMAMLSDTLGTRAFMKAANYVSLPAEDGRRQRFLDIVGTARQDSGKLPDFVHNMVEFGYVGGDGAVKAMMASEIDTTDTLLEASNLGYASFGAGGFFGDSEKVWGDKNAPSNSMAVKAVRVMYAAEPGRDYSKISYVKVVDANVIGYPVKVGDPSDFKKPQLGEGKLSVDKNLPARKIETVYDGAQKPYPIINKVSVEGIKEYAEGVRVAAQAPLDPSLTATKPIESFFTVEGGVNYGGLEGGSNNSWFNYFFN